MSQSHTVVYLKGKMLPDTTSPVKDVTKWGPDRRRVELRDGTIITYSKEDLKKAFNEVLSAHQSKAALKTIRTREDMSSVTIGGVIKGERKTYQTIAACKAAITRHYKIKK